jgi:Fe-S oxidoreductase
MKFEDEKSLLEDMGLDVEIPDSGCCGMAGAFGFEKKHYDIAVACGERKILPTVRDASSDTYILADGFSCREQIRQGTGRKPLHLSQLIQKALAKEAPGELGAKRRRRLRTLAPWIAAGAVAAGTGAALWHREAGR